MKKTLIIGSTVVDVIIGIEKLPKTQEDTHTTSHKMGLGGCAYNVSEILRQSKIPYVLASPVGSGAYGTFVENSLNEKGIPIFAKTPLIENGCCYCFVEKTGERTFISHHGAEYLFSEKWFENLNLEEFDSIYICGLEVEEKTGDNLITWLEKISKHNLQIYFAPGPRFIKIDSKLLDRIFALNPIIHLNELEAKEFSKENNIKEAARFIFNKTKNSCVITLGSSGCLYLNAKKNNKVDFVPLSEKEKKIQVIDTIGAGDSHIGALISALKLGLCLDKACAFANAVSSAVVGISGSSLNDETFNKIKLI